MNQTEIRKKVQEGLAFFWDNTFNSIDLENYLLQLVEENSASAAMEKERVEKLLHYSEEVRELQVRYFKGDKSVLSKSKEAEHKLDTGIKWLKAKGYKTEQYKKKTEQTGLFNQ